MQKIAEKKVAVLAGLIASIALVLSGCSAPKSDSAADASGEVAAVAAGELPVVAVSSYPLAFVAQSVGGDEIRVLDLSTKGGHAHDMELSPSQIKELSSADVALYLSQGFQPAVESAITQVGIAGMDGFSAIPAEDQINGDPHVWLNPMNLAAIGEELAVVLDQANPQNDGYYQANAAALTEEMTRIDSDYSAALAPCAGATLLTSHEAFGYLAKRFDLDQEGVMGIDPDAEPSPARLRDVMKLISDRNITTLFIEPTGEDYGLDGDDHDHGSSQWGAKLAATLGVDYQTLDPLEVQVNPTKDVIDVFEMNLQALQKGLPCASGS